MPKTKAKDITEAYKVSVPEGKSGVWSVVKYTVSPEQETYQRLRCMFNPQRETRVVPAGSYTGLFRGDTLVMSDTPDEIKDHMGVINSARGNVYVAGLGLGMVTRAILEKDTVDKVTVVELSPDVIKLVGTELKEKYGDRLEIVNANAMTWLPPDGTKYDLAWFDIWDTISMGNLDDMQHLDYRFEDIAEHRGFWQIQGCIAQRKRIEEKTGLY